MAQRGEPRTDRRQRDKFRRRRPYLIDPIKDKAGADGDSSTSRWVVKDMNSGEEWGEIERDASSATDKYTIVHGMMAGNQSSSASMDYRTLWAASDAVWKAACPTRWWSWFLMSWMVQTSDWLSRMFGIGALVFAMLLAVSSASSLWDTKESLGQWLEDTSHRLSSEDGRPDLEEGAGNTEGSQQ